MGIKSFSKTSCLAAAIAISLLQAAFLPAQPVLAKAKKAKPEPQQTVQSKPADHSAEYEPVKNEFLKEGEAVPGSQIPLLTGNALSQEEQKLAVALKKEIRTLQMQRAASLKAREKKKAEKQKAFEKAFSSRQEYSIDFDPSDYTVKTMNANGEKVTFRAYEHLVYVKKPYDPESQMLSIYIPEGYFKGKTINGFTAETAPIFLPNGVGGYMPGAITEPQEESRHGGANTVLYALSNGYVVVSPAIRGRSLKHKNGYDTGKAPALIVDYKAAVRFVRYNRKAGRIPAGDTEKIISSGTSAGGALSALLGATGNAKEYGAFLKEIGAADSRDDIFAAMAYCPITNLENADAAYEWMFQDADTYYNTPASAIKRAEAGSQRQREEKLSSAIQGRPENAPAETRTGTPITPEQKDLSAELSEHFTDYLNSLDLRDSLNNRLNLAPDGEGLFREYIESLYLSSAQDAIDTGEDITGVPWLLISDGKAVKMDFPAYVKTVKRLKGIPAFDAFDMSTGENNEFGSANIASRHFTQYALEHSHIAAIPMKAKNLSSQEKELRYMQASPLEKLHLQKQDLLEQIEKDKMDSSPYIADSQTVKMMNPMNYIGNPDIQTAPHWRIRHGVLDRDTALAIPAMLALKLKNNGKAVDFKVPWGYGHDGDYDLPDLFAWTDRICKVKDKAGEILKSEKKNTENAERKD